MTEPAAIQASYADYRRVKGRKVLQLIFEVPLEMAPQVHEAFGEPLPDGSTWVAVVRIEPGNKVVVSHIDSTAKPERKGGKLAQRAGILCNEGAFARFIGIRLGADGGQQVSVEGAADYVRELCEITSRADLDHNDLAAAKFRELESSYRAWLSVAA